MRLQSLNVLPQKNASNFLSKNIKIYITKVLTCRLFLFEVLFLFFFQKSEKPPTSSTFSMMESSFWWGT